MQRLNRVIRLTTLGVVGMITFSAASFGVRAATIPESVEKKLIAVCQAIKSDSRADLHRAVKKSGISYRRLSEGLVCNGMDMYSFALQHSANKTGAVIASRTNLEDKTLTAKAN